MRKVQPETTPRLLRVLAPLVSVGAVLFGLVSAVRLRWICDDAFISFRYALNLTRGLGLVFNEGERVEGYTNFLWTVIMAAALRAGVTAEVAAQSLGVLAFAGTIATLLWFSRLFRGHHAGGLWFPVAAVGFALHFHARVFATGGLETSLFTFLVTLGTLLCARSDSRSQFFGFFCFGLAALTRPEGIVFYACAGLVLAVFSFREVLWGARSPAQAVGAQARLHLGFMVLWLPFVLWRYSYYGAWLPNTYYAKSGGSAHYGQGLIYTALYFSAYYVFFVAPLLFFFLRGRAHSSLRSDANAPVQPGGTEPNEARTAALIALPVSVLTFYYTRVGGDFMFGRFFVPITPLLFMGMEMLFRRWVPERRRLLAHCAVALATLASWNPYRGRPLPQIYGITQEHEIYRPPVLAAAAATASSWKKAFRKSRARIAIGGAQAFIAYHSDASFVLESAAGLTDYYLARVALEARGAVMGHEKQAPLAYLRQRRIHLHLNALYAAPVPEYARVTFPLGNAAVICYESAVIEELRAIPGFRIPRFEDYLDGYIRGMARRSRAEVERDYAQFRAYYFSCTKDSARESYFRERLRLP